MKRVHRFSGPGKALCGARGALRFSLEPSQITCSRCMDAGPRRFDLHCVSCPWSLRTNDAKKAEREALQHMDENGHAVMDERKED